MRLFVFDITGREQNEPRWEFLLKRMAAKDVVECPAARDRSSSLPEGLLKNPAIALLLVHSTDLSGSKEQEFRKVAAAGATLIFYSGGDIDENAIATEKGWILT